MKKRKYIKIMTLVLVFIMTFSLNININMDKDGTSSSPNKHFLQMGVKSVHASPSYSNEIITISNITINDMPLENLDALYINRLSEITYSFDVIIHNPYETEPYQEMVGTWVEFETDNSLGETIYAYNHNAHPHYKIYLPVYQLKSGMYESPKLIFNTKTYSSETIEVNLPPITINLNEPESLLGCYVKLGKSIDYNKEYDIIWRFVIEEDDGYILWSRYAIDEFIYGMKDSYKDHNWENSTNRYLMNTENGFLKKFNEDEKKLLMPRTHRYVYAKGTAPGEPHIYKEPIAEATANYDTCRGGTATDKVFLLSIPEVKQVYDTFSYTELRAHQLSFEENTLAYGLRDGSYEDAGENSYYYAYRAIWWGVNSPDVNIIKTRDNRLRIRPAIKVNKDFKFTGGGTLDDPIVIITNVEPEIAVTKPSPNSPFSEVDGHNTIAIAGTVKDDDTDDTFTVKYEFGSKTGILLENVSSNSGQVYNFNGSIVVDNTIPEGNHIVKIIAEDDKGGITKKEIPIKVDKTGPVSTLEDTNVKAKSISEIEIKTTATDNMIGLKDNDTYLFNKDGQDIGTWTSENTIIDTGLKANKKYSYKFKAVDKLDNIGEYSNIIDRYTLALNPVKVKLTNSKADSLTFEITNNVDNDEVPETKLIAKKKGTTEIVSISDWSKETIKTISGLTDGQEYEIYLNARNGDKIQNCEDGSEIKLTSDSNPPLVNDKDEPINGVITVPKKPVIKEVIPITSDIEAKEIKVTWNAVQGATKYALYVIPEGEERKLVNDNITELSFTHTGLTPNRKYTYYLQAGNAGGFSEDSEPVERFTQALSVKGANGLEVIKSNADSIIFKVLNDAKNHNVPETQIEIKDKSGNIISTSTFTMDIENRTLINLSQNIEYEVWVTTRNNDKDGFKIANAPELVFNSIYCNRKPELQSITLSEGSHHKGKPLKVNIQSKEFDIGDKINAFYSITGILTAQNKQISRPLDADPFNYQHNSTIAEYEGYIDFTGDEANGTYEITFWLEDNSGLKSDTIVKTFKIVKEDYYLENLKDIAEKGTNEELKEAIEAILGDEFDELYFPNPLPEHMTEGEYLDIIREQIKDMEEPITKEAVRKMIALVNINCRLSFGRQNTIPKKEIVIVLDTEAHRYKDSYLSDYQKELKRAYGKDGNPIMRLAEIDVLNAIKLVNFNKLPIESITVDIITDLIGDNPPLNNNLIDGYKEAIKDLRDEVENPTLEDIKTAIEIVNINDKIDKSTLTIEDLKKLLPDLVIYPEYWNEYLRYLRMYKIDLGRNLNKDDIRIVIESVNGVIDYEKSATDDNHNKAKEKISLLVDGLVKTELTERISPLEKPIIDTSMYDNQSKNTLNRLSSVLDCYTASEPVLIELMGNKTIVSSTPIIDLRVINIKGASHIRYMSQENTKDSYNEWKPINSNEDIRKLVYKDQGIYLSGVQAKNSYKQSEIEDINVVIDWTAPKGKIVKKNPSQTVTKNSSITIKVVAEDNLKMPMYIKDNGYWRELKDEFFEYELETGEGEKLIEVILSDVAGNKTYLHERVWRVIN